MKDFYDVIVVGGGINGCGIARDLSLRGLGCLLVEKNDFGAETSWASSGMIHGGPRYMLSNLDVTRLSCLDSGFIQKIAPHLLFRIPFLYPVYHTRGLSRLKAQLKLSAVDAFFSAYDQFAPLKGGKPHTRLTPRDVAKIHPGVQQDGLLGAVTFDEWGVDVPRLCIANVIDAIEHGADALNHAVVSKVFKDDHGIKAVEICDAITANKSTVRTRMLINATGPWSGEFAKLMGVDIKLRGTKGVHIVFDRRMLNVAVVGQAIDGREIFIFPFENTTILGTTDDDYFGNLDDQRVTNEEVQYLLEGISHVFPDASQMRKIFAYSGVRPTLYKRGCYEDDLSRAHKVIDHAQEHQLTGCLSIVGGKLAAYRIMAKEVSDLACEKLSFHGVSTTHLKPLPGGGFAPDVLSLSKRYDIDPYAVSRLAFRHGSRVEQVLEPITRDRKLASPVCGCEPVLMAEIRYVLTHELIRKPADLMRRTRITMGPCLGMNCMPALLGIWQEFTGKSVDEAQREINNFLDRRWHNQAIVLSSAQLKQEMLKYHMTAFKL